MSELRQALTVLEANGHRLTASRLAVLAEAYAAPAQFTAEDIHRGLPRVGRATVFRTIKLLLDQGLLCRVRMDGGRLLYRWSRPDHHHHLVCKSCGAVEDMSRCGVAELLQQAVGASGYTLEGHWLEVYGRCARCQEVGDASRSQSA